MTNKKVQLHDLDLVGYQEAWDYQKNLFDTIIEQKLRKRHGEAILTQNHLVVCQHPHVYTLGKSGDKKHLLLNQEGLADRGVEFVPTSRGGDITYHGPGQLVVYPILDLDNFFTDIHKYLRYLEEAVILTLQQFGIKGERIEKLTGVWIDTEKQARKICAMGVKASRWVTMHGLALNIQTDLNYFNYIVPCGIVDKGVTSMHKEISTEIDFAEVSGTLVNQLCNLFQMELINN